ncbi:MAG: DNA polymerase III subunit gamma/tau [Pirellulales bacterium]|nr:DNA polymerase III subunit gamma/tau [Pirellulales bacterium]
MDDPRSADFLGSDGGHETGRQGEYLVVARRYRPQSFDELIGQEHVGRALSNAITTGRVGHAYLFTGARGVGKTSSARIFAKALNCEQGPTPTPCNECDACLRISTGDDVDVLEIDGASNRGIDEMRELRQNVNVRPSRSRFKIYIIDEVHMLTREAFNALLKTLEEPPEHVKFIFCTTEAEKIPITILSRCQRFDFAGIQTPSIVARLRQIVDAEGVVAEDAALESLARRAAGSMRDSQSLLEQLLSFCGERITVADVHRMLGTAADQRLGTLASHLVTRHAAEALAELDRALAEGVDVGQFVGQLLGYFRDVMVVAAGGAPEMLLYTSSQDPQPVQEAARSLGVHTVLAVMQILDETLGRLRYSTQGRTLAELALVRITTLGDLERIADLLAEANGQPADAVSPPARPAPGGASAPGGAKLPSAPAAPSRGERAHDRSPRAETQAQIGPRPASAAAVADEPRRREEPRQAMSERSSIGERVEADFNEVAAMATAALVDDDLEPPLDEAPLSGRPLPEAGVLWQQTLAKLPDQLARFAATAESVAISAPNRLVVGFGTQYTFGKSMCEKPDRLEKLEKALSEVAGRLMRIAFEVLENSESARPVPEVRASRPASSRERLQEASQHPLVRRAAELFGARPVAVEGPESS